MAAQLNELDIRKLLEEVERLKVQNAHMDRLLNTPEFLNFREGIRLEAAHQVKRWGPSHDRGKGPLDWFWLIGYLAQKIVHSDLAGDKEKALHHCVSTAAACANWHESITQKYVVTEKSGK